MKNKKKFFFLIILIFTTVLTRFYTLENFFIEIDGTISFEKLKYEKIDLYDIANDKDSSSYNSNLKIYIRELQSKNNKAIDYVQKKFSDIIVNLTPSKTSTYAPLQFLIFGWMLNSDQNLDQLKFYSRLPSAIFSILSVIIIYFISRKIFKNNIYLVYLPSVLLTFSYPIIFISQKSYNYSAAVFAITLLFYLFLRENSILNNKKKFIDNSKIKLNKNFYFSIILALSSYLSYLCLILIPSFFMFKFLKNYLDKKKFFSYSNYNLFICGLIYSFMILPLLIHMIKLNLQDYGALDASGINDEYSITGKKGEYIKFFIYNFYLIVIKNLSFFLDSFVGAKIFQLIIFGITMLGLASIFNNKINRIQKVILLMFIFNLFYWCVLVFFNQTTFGPIRQLLWLTPLLCIIFTIGIKRINDFLFKSHNLFSMLIIFFITSIFFINYSNFVNYHKELFDEKKINNLISKYNIRYIVSNPTVSQICFMKTIKIKINTCPKRYYRHGYQEKFNEKILQDVRKQKGSIAFINYKFTKQNKLDLLNYKFEELFAIEKVKYLSGTTPLYVGKQSPNFMRILIYR